MNADPRLGIIVYDGYLMKRNIAVSELEDCWPFLCVRVLMINRANVARLLVVQLTIRRLRLKLTFIVMLSRDPYIACEYSDFVLIVT